MVLRCYTLSMAASKKDPLPDNVVTIDGKPFTVVELDKANKRRITAAAKARYLVLLEEGLNRSEAAHELGLTGTKMRGEAKRDPEFGKAVDEAIERSYPAFQDRLRNTYVRRALDPDGPPMLINNLAIVHLPEFAILRKTQLEGELGIKALPTLDTSRYTDEELETLRDLLSRGERPEIEK